MTPTLNTADPKAYILAHDKRVRQLDRLAVAHLNTIWSDALGNTLIYTGPMSHDELVSAIAAVEYPEIRTAREVYAQSVADARLDAITEALQSIPLEVRVPGHGHAGMPGLAKADLLALLNDED